MNYYDHILRELILDGTATITLTVGTENPLYPVSHLYNGRPGIPFRCVDTTIAILIDFGAAKNISTVWIPATNLERITANAIRLQAGTTDAVADYSAYASLFGAKDNESDYRGVTFLYPVGWAPAQNKRYWKVTLTQTNRVADYTQLGELWFEETGDHAWFDEDETDEEINGINLSWGARLVDHGSAGNLSKGMRIAKSMRHRADVAGMATLLQMQEKNSPIAHLGDGDFGQSRSFDFLNTRVFDSDQWRVSENVDYVWQTFEGDGRVVE